jgi:cytochrome b subunit of formate dehydrogenase
MIDSSYIEMFILIAKPLTEEFEPPWNYVRMVFWGLVPIAILSLVTGFILEPTPEYLDVRKLFFNLSLVVSVMAAALYAVCAWQAMEVHRAREHEKSDRVRRFRD